MKDEPEIVKLLREEERQGKLQLKVACSYVPLQIQDEPPDETSSETSMTYSDEVDRDTTIQPGSLEERYNIIFENMAVAITLTDKDERIISWNDYAEKLLEMTKDDLYLKPVKTLYPEEEWKKIRAEDVRKKGIKYRMKTKMLKKHSGVVDVELSLCMLRSSKGTNVGSIGIIKDITELKEMKRRFQESEFRYKTIFENSAVAITLTDSEERIISWNTFTEALLGMNEKDLYGKPVQSLYPPEEWKKIRSQNVRQKGMQHSLETIVLTKDNQQLHVNISLSVLKDHTGHVIGSIGVIKDITEQKHIEQELEASEQKFRQLYTYAPVPYHMLSPSGNITDVNERWCKTFGYSRDEVVGKPIFKLIASKERKEAETSFQQKIESKQQYTGGHERIFLTKNGEERVFVTHDFFSYSPAGDVISVHTTLEDITDRKHVEEMVKQKEEKYRAIFELSPQAIAIIDEKGTIIDVNKRVYEWLGYKSNEIIGKSITKLPFVAPENKRKLIERFQQRMEGKEQPAYELEFLTKQGEKRVGMVYGSVIRDKQKKIIADLVVISDITEQHKAWEEMVKSEEKYRVLAETSADGVFTTDVLGRLTYVNPSLEKLLGRRKGKILATPSREYLSESSVYLFQQVILDVRKMDSKMENVELTIMHEDGYEIPIEVNVAPLKKDQGFVGIECTVRDVTEKHKVLRELKKSENLRTEFMNIAAHELKSPVTPIKGYLELIESDKDSTERLRNWARIGLRNAERLLGLVNDILDVSRLDTDTMRFHMENINLTEVLTDTAEDMRPAAENKKLKLKTKIPDNLPQIRGDRYRLSQVLKNLLGNALKFTDYGSITLDAEHKDNTITITVKDTGIGISRDELKKIFTKFYQAYTGEDRKNEGTGLGLFICKEIVKKHNGTIRAESTVGKGSAFIIELPT